MYAQEWDCCVSQRFLKQLSFIILFSLCYSYWMIFIVLYSRSFIHSSVSLNFLFMSSINSVFLFQLSKSSFLTGSFFILSSFLLKFHCLDQLLSLIQLTFVVPVFLHSLSGKILTCFLIFFRCCLTLSIETSFSTFSLFLSFSASMNLREAVTYWSVKELFLYVSIPT